MAQPRRITVDIERCMGCHTCELACAIAHSEAGDIEKIVAAGENPGYRINVEAFRSRPVPVACQHCEEPACVLACPTGAVHRKADGKPVLVDQERCIGCFMCVQACPFGMMGVRSDGKVAQKCDLCIQRLAKGLKPACVSSCPTRALSFVQEEEGSRDKRRAAAERLVAAQESGAREEVR